MAIDHFGVPAIYLVDLARLLPDASAAVGAARGDGARLALLPPPWRPRSRSRGAFLPRWAAGPDAGRRGTDRRPDRRAYGTTAALPRPEQLLRKIAHFDTVADAIRYTRRADAPQPARALGTDGAPALGTGAARAVDCGPRDAEGAFHLWDPPRSDQARPRHHRVPAARAHRAGDLRDGPAPRAARRDQRNLLP